MLGIDKIEEIRTAVVSAFREDILSDGTGQPISAHQESVIKISSLICANILAAYELAASGKS